MGSLLGGQSRIRLCRRSELGGLGGLGLPAGEVLRLGERLGVSTGLLQGGLFGGSAGFGVRLELLGVGDGGCGGFVLQDPGAGLCCLAGLVGLGCQLGLFGGVLLGLESLGERPVGSRGQLACHGFRSGPLLVGGAGELDVAGGGLLGGHPCLHLLCRGNLGDTRRLGLATGHVLGVGAESLGGGCGLFGSRPLLDLAGRKSLGLLLLALGSLQELGQLGCCPRLLCGFVHVLRIDVGRGRRREERGWGQRRLLQGGV